MVRTRGGTQTSAFFYYDALPEAARRSMCMLLGADTQRLEQVCRATKESAGIDLVNGLLEEAGRPNGAAGILDGMDIMCRLRRGALFECCRDPRFRDPKYEWQCVACVVRVACVERDSFRTGAA